MKEELKYQSLLARGVLAPDLPEIQDEEVDRAIRSVPVHRSANLLVDLANTALLGVSLAGNGGGAGTGGATIFGSGSAICVASGTTIGQTVDMINADTYTNLFAAGQTASGQLRLQVQVSDSDTSGNFTDPTSGLAAFPGAFQSGGILWINSGGTTGGVLGAQVSGQAVASGFLTAQGFIRPGRFARVNALTEGTVQFAGPLIAGLIGNYRTTGSGGGYSLSPSSGSVNV